MHSSRKYTFLAAALVIAMLSGLCVTDLMRESDQASLVKGAFLLSRGSSLAHQAFYNYDKQYGFYWLIALALRVCAWFGKTGSPVFVANAATAFLFWSTTILGCLLLAKRRPLPSTISLGTFLLTPAVILDSVYANTAIVSAGFLLLAAALILGSASGYRRLAGCLCFFIAVSARGDAVLLIPLLIWLGISRYRWFRSLWTGKITWLLVGSAVMASLLGRWIFTGRGLYFDFVFRGWRVFAAYMVFGLGASLGLVLLFVGLLLSCAARSSKQGKRLFFLAGALSLLMPLAFYSLQLYSPRYLILTALGIFVFSVSRRGQALLRLQPARRVMQSGRWAMAVVTALLLVAGLRLETISHPKVVFSEPTLYPTTDGLHSMGAYLSFLWNLRNVDSRAIDHNQLIWAAARAARYQPSKDGFVHILDTQMMTYLDLGATLAGYPVKVDESDNIGSSVYADSRSFMRLGWPDFEPLRRVLGRPATIVSPVYNGVAIVWFNSGGDRAWNSRTTLLDSLFGGNEYRLYSASRFRGDPGKPPAPVAFLADRPFSVDLDGSDRPLQATQDRNAGLYYVWCGVKPSMLTFRVSGVSADRVSLVTQALPGWMTIR